MPLSSWLAEKIQQYFLKEVITSRPHLCDFDKVSYEVRPTDILLVEGRTRMSKIIKNTLFSPWTHAALYIGRLHDIDDAQIREYVQKHYQGSPKDQLLLESELGIGTVITSLNKYQDHHVRICRPNGIDRKDVQKVIEFATSHLGNEYNIRHFFDLGRFYLRSLFIPRKWGSTLFKYRNNTNEDVCSVLIADAFASVKFPILPVIRTNEEKKIEMITRNPWLCTPCDFDYSPYFDIIKYPMIPEEHRAAYRKFPWKKEYISNDDEGIARTTEFKKNGNRTTTDTNKPE